jgi:hypothetical protein
MTGDATLGRNGGFSTKSLPNLIRWVIVRRRARAVERRKNA